MRRAATPARLLLGAAVLIACVVALFGLVFAKSVPMIVSATAILGIGLFLFGCIAVGSVIRAGRRGDGALAFAAAMFGGLCMLGASGSLAIAIVLGLLAASA